MSMRLQSARDVSESSPFPFKECIGFENYFIKKHKSIAQVTNSTGNRLKELLSRKIADKKELVTEPQ